MKKETAERPSGGKTRSTTVPASEVKNAWHRYLQRVSQGHEEVVVTRYGKPLLRMIPYEAVEERPPIFGFLSGTVTVRGDIIAPTDERWDADA